MNFFKSFAALWALLLVAVVSASPAFAAQIDDIPMASSVPVPPELQTFLRLPDQKKQIFAMMAHQWKTIVPSCPESHLKHDRVVIEQAPSFDKSGTPVTGRWRFIGLVEGCNASHIFTILYDFGPNRQLKRIGLLPGTTVADMQLQREALQHVGTGVANLVPKDCEKIDYIDTKFLGFAETVPDIPAGSNNRAWDEEWTVKACGVTGIVPLHFKPTAPGKMAMTVETEKTRRVSP
jgi:hypothetical protein